MRIIQRPMIGMAGTSPAMTEWGCRKFCPCYELPKMRATTGLAFAACSDIRLHTI
jgi:hypothetical protein